MRSKCLVDGELSQGRKDEGRLAVYFPHPTVATSLPHGAEDAICIMRYFFMNKMSKTKKELLRLCLAAMFLAMSVVIGYLCKTLFNSFQSLFRVSFDTLPIILTGILLGPVWGGAVGLCSDLLTYFITPQPLPPIPMVTVGYAMVGIVSGIMAKYVIKKQNNAMVILSAGAAHLVGSMICKIIGLFAVYGWLVLVRIPIYLIVAAVEILLICFIINNKIFKKMLQEFGV